MIHAKSYILPAAGILLLISNSESKFLHSGVENDRFKENHLSFETDLCRSLFNMSRCRVSFLQCDTVLNLGNAIQKSRMLMDSIGGNWTMQRQHGRKMIRKKMRLREMIQRYQEMSSIASKNIFRVKRKLLSSSYKAIQKYLYSTCNAMNMRRDDSESIFHNSQGYGEDTVLFDVLGDDVYSTWKDRYRNTTYT
uniref:uncharacterized protein LOC120348422 n=1 Tax=Styela clava TaxID=7725 RepID=UPI00193AD721|nr:uncharacterized protein LOC120348422 [Styela clava]